MGINISENNVNPLGLFFRRRITLVVGIMFFVSVITMILMSCFDIFNSLTFSSQEDKDAYLLIFFFDFFIGILNLLPAISFFLLFFNSKNSPSKNYLSTPATLLTVFSVISLVLTIGLSIFTVVILCLLVLIPFFIIITIGGIAVIMVAAPVVITYFISLIVASRSVANSRKRILIKSGPIIFLGVMCILLCLGLICLMTPTFLISVNETLQLDFDFSSISAQLPLIIRIFSAFLANLFLAIWCFCYVGFAHKTNAYLKSSPYISYQNSNQQSKFY